MFPVDFIELHVIQCTRIAEEEQEEKKNKEEYIREERDEEKVEKKGGREYKIGIEKKGIKTEKKCAGNKK